MHASLWILISPNGILSLPLMSVRMQPPYADCQEPRWKLHGSLLSVFVPVSVLNIAGEGLCVQERSKTFSSFFLVCFPLSLCLPLRARWAVMTLSRGMRWENRHSRPVRECSFTLLLVLLCVLKCLYAWDSKLLELWRKAVQAMKVT